MNPGDFRVVTEGRGCGNSGCHDTEHAQWVPASPLGSDRFFGPRCSRSVSRTRWRNSATTSTTRWAPTRGAAQSDPFYLGVQPRATKSAASARCYEIPTGLANYGDPTGIYNNPVYDANALANYVQNAVSRAIS